MASRRMFNINFIESDTFSELSQGARLLYFYAMASADDDGFFTTLKKCLFFVGANQEQFDELIDAGLILSFGNVYVITHWKQHNHIQKDRYTHTIHDTEYRYLIVNEDKSYSVSKEYTERIRNVSMMESKQTQGVSADKTSSGQDRLVEYSNNNMFIQKDERPIDYGIDEIMNPRGDSG